ncbi:hypothetical protein FO519_004220 [Halicephalobus sp. NKZ332]|nr:hypothetical protein FO519_004220 [Halicephalobus sp. NKZ332]
MSIVLNTIASYLSSIKEEVETHIGGHKIGNDDVRGGSRSDTVMHTEDQNQICLHMANGQEMWFMDEEMNFGNQNPESGFSDFNEFNQVNFNDFQQSFQDQSCNFNCNHSRSPSGSPSISGFQCDIRRGRPLLPDDQNESEKIKQRRKYARYYREKVRAEKSKLTEQNEKLKDLTQRALSLYSRVQTPSFLMELQNLQQEFISICSTTSPLQSTNGSFEEKSSQYSYERSF